MIYRIEHLKSVLKGDIPELLKTEKMFIIDRVKFAAAEITQSRSSSLLVKPFESDVCIVHQLCFG